MKKRSGAGRLFLPVFILCLLCGQALAAELPGELRAADPETAARLEESGDYGLLSGAADIWAESVGTAKRQILAGLRGAAAVMAGVTLLGAAESIAPQKNLSRYTTVVGALWVTAMSAGDLEGLIGLGRETIIELSQFSKILLPSLWAASPPPPCGRWGRCSSRTSS